MPQLLILEEGSIQGLWIVKRMTAALFCALPLPDNKRPFAGP